MAYQNALVALPLRLSIPTHAHRDRRLPEHQHHQSAYFAERDWSLGGDLLQPIFNADATAPTWLRPNTPTMSRWQTIASRCWSPFSKWKTA